MKVFTTPNSQQVFLMGDDNVIDALHKMAPTFGEPKEILVTGSTMLHTKYGQVNAVSIETVDNVTYYLVRKNPAGLTPQQLEEVFKIN